LGEGIAHHLGPDLARSAGIGEFLERVAAIHFAIGDDAARSAAAGEEKAEEKAEEKVAELRHEPFLVRA
jgi:hypothetical protein